MLNGLINTTKNILGLNNKPEYKEDIIGYVKNQYEIRKNNRLPLELQWRLNINFHNGNQFCKIDTVSNKIEKVDPFAWHEEREVFNQIAPTIETRLAKLEKVVDLPKVRPATSENADVSSAKVSSKYLHSYSNKTEMTLIRKDTDLWAELTGTGAYKTIWNPNKGKVIGIVQNDMPVDEDKENLEEFEKDEVEGKSVKRFIHEGEPEIISISPFEIYPEDINKDFLKNRSIIHVQIFTPEEVFEKWGVVVKGGTNSVMSLNSITGHGSLGQKGNAYILETKQQENTVRVYEYYQLPTYRYPEGRLIICTDNELIYYGKLPQTIGREGEYRLPFVVQKCLNTHGFFGKSIIERMIPAQRRYNSIKNRKKEYLNRCTIGNLLYEEGSIDEDLFEEGIAPGDMVPYKPGYNPPSWMQFHQLPNSFEIEERNLLEEFNRLSGVSELSKLSTAPSSIDSGVALSMLVEQDDTRSGLSASNYKSARLLSYQNLLYIYKENVTHERIIRDVGSDMEVDVFAFSGSNITSFDIYFEAESELSESPAQRRQFVFDLLRTGLFNDPETGGISKEGRLKVFEMLKLGNWEDFDKSDNLHIQKAKRENSLLAKGKMPKVLEIDDDLTHIKTHNNFRLTSEYEGLAEANPQIDELFTIHVNEHLNNLQIKAQQQQLEQPAEEEGGENNEQNGQTY